MGDSVWHDLSTHVLTLLLGAMSGMVATLAAQWWYLFRPQPQARDKSTATPAHPVGPATPVRPLPALLEIPPDAKLPTEPCLWLNLAVGFLFRELRDSIGVRRFTMRRLERNIRYLVQSTSARNFIEKLTVEELELGDSMPVLDRMVLLPPKDGTLGDADDLDIVFDMSYTGACRVQLHVDLVFAHNASSTLTLHNLHGRMRFGLRRHPRPHYTLVFIEEPSIGCEVSSLFEGRSVPQLNNLLNTQIRRALAKFHTFPAEKHRYEPFFRAPTADHRYDLRWRGKKMHVGHVKATVVGAVELLGVRAGAKLYCTLSLPADDRDGADDGVGTHAGRRGAGGKVEDRLTVRLVRADDVTPFGIEFQTSRSPGRSRCQVAATRPQSPAGNAGLKAGDTIMRIGQRWVYSPKQATRLLLLVHLSVKVVVSRSSSVAQLAAANPSSDADHDSAISAAGTTADADVFYRTSSVDPAGIEGASSAYWNESAMATTGEEHTTLLLKVYDRKPHKKGIKLGKEDLLIGVAKVLLQDVALYCATTGHAYSTKLALQASELPASGMVGWIELAVAHSSAPGSAAEMSSPGGRHESFNGPLPASATSVSGLNTPDGVDVQQELPTNRAELDAMMSTVQTHIDLEAETRSELERQLDEAGPEHRPRLKANIKYSDERMHDLAARMIRVVSALREQHDPD